MFDQVMWFKGGRREARGKRKQFTVADVLIPTLKFDSPAQPSSSVVQNLCDEDHGSKQI